MESSLAETSSTLEALVAATPAAIVVLDTEARVTLWSPGAVRLFGWTAEEVVGRRTPLRPGGRPRRRRLRAVPRRARARGGLAALQGRNERRGPALLGSAARP